MFSLWVNNNVCSLLENIHAVTHHLVASDNLGGYSDAGRLCCNFNVLATRYAAVPFAFCFLVVILTSSMATHFTFYFLSLCIALTLGAASGVKDVILHE